MQNIYSRQNQNIKILNALVDDAVFRKQQNQFVIEGANLIKDAPKSIVKKIFVRQNSLEKHSQIIDKFDCEKFIVEDNVFDKIKNTVSSNGLVAVCDIPKMDSNMSNWAILIDKIQDPGNLGTIIRTVAAMGHFTIILINSADPYNPKVVRASMGGIFHTNIISLNNYDDCFKLVNGYDILALDLVGENIYKTSFNSNQKLAICVGNESQGLSKEIRSAANKIINIPMPSKKMDSLNVGVSLSIVLSYIVSHA